MANELQSNSHLISAPGVNVDALLKAFLEGRSAVTMRAYRKDLLDFAAFLDLKTADEAAKALLQRTPGEANLLVLQYRTSLMERKLSPATVNRHLSAIRSMVDLANTFGMISWHLSVKNLPSQAYRDTKGPGKAGIEALMAAASAQRPEKSARDKAILILLYANALRRFEVAALDLEHIDLQQATLSIMGKGRLERETVTLPRQVVAALEAWIAVRGAAPGPLFPNCDRARKGKGRLTGNGVFRIVKAMAKKANIEARPHGLRHTAITMALDRTKDVRAVQKFSRHARLETLMRYDDNRCDLGGIVAQTVADALVG